MTKELTGANKVRRTETEAKAKAVDLVKKEEWARAMGRRGTMEKGELFYKLHLEKDEDGNEKGNFEKMDLLDKAILADDQVLYRGVRAKLRFFMNYHIGAQEDAIKWVKMMKKECHYKVQDQEIQSILFQCYINTNNLPAANFALKRDFEEGSDMLRKHEKDLMEAEKKKN